jgi:hypothetical protein
MGERICWIKDLLIAFEHRLKILLIVVFSHRFLLSRGFPTIETRGWRLVDGDLYPRIFDHPYRTEKRRKPPEHAVRE